MQCEFSAFDTMHGLLTMTISLAPTLINRSVLSLKKAADGSNGVNRAWNMGHASTVKFAHMPVPASSAILVARRQGDPLEIQSDTNGHNAIPLNELRFVYRRDHNAKRLRASS